jgi:lipoic acid synthetase
MDEPLTATASPPATGVQAGVKQKGAGKTARIPIKVVAAETLRKPPWIRVRAASSPRFLEI